MFTQCPNCQGIQAITVEQLRLNRAIAYCKPCAIRFDALELLSETTDKPSASLSPLPWEQAPSSPKKTWSVAALAASLLLVGQFFYFESGTLTQQESIRPLLLTLCQKLACQLPDYRNLQEISILAGALTPNSNQHYLLNAVINNHAPFKQRAPDLILSLLDYSGQTFSYRRFKPEDYLIGTNSEQMATDAILTINLEIAATQTPIGGYNLELSY